jgi:type II secretory pathway component PulF
MQLPAGAWAVIAFQRWLPPSRDLLVDLAIAVPIALALAAVGWVLIDAARRCAARLGIASPLGIACVMIVSIVGLCVFVVLVVYTGILPFVVLVVGLAVYMRYRAAGENLMLTAIGIAAARGLPAGPAARAFGQLGGRSSRERAERLAGLLEAGVSLPEALEQSRAATSAESQMTVRLGCQTGELGPSIEELVARRWEREAIWGPAAAKIAYLTCLAFFGILVGGFLSLMILPAYVRIFADFHLPLPRQTVFAMRLSNWFAQFGVPVVLVLFVLVVYVLMRYIGWVPWEPRFMGRFTRRLDAATILDSLALAVQRDQPLLPMVTLLADRYPRASVRERLARVAGDLSVGADCWDSLHARGLIRQADRAVLQSAARAGNLPWALGEMADSSVRRFTYRAQLLLQVLFPLVILGYSAAVAVIAVGYFVPLVALVHSLAL